MTLYDEYIKAVKSGKRNAGKLEKLGVKHFQRLRRKYEFDEDEVDRMMEIVSHCCYPSGKWYGKKFELLPHQAFMVAGIFGLKDKDGNRLIREAMMNMAKKGGKSAFGGLIAVLFTFFDGERDAENYVVANKTEQAMFCWGAAKKILTQLGAKDEEFAKSYKIYDTKMEHKIIDLVNNNFLKTLPYDSATLDGVNPHLAIIDEYHGYKDDKIPGNLATGMALRSQPLMLYVTTRGHNPYGALASKEAYYESILNEVIEVDNVLPMIYAMDKPGQWKNSNHWIKVCPGIDAGLPPRQFLQAQQTNGLQKGGTELVEVKTKNFNLWQRSSAAFVNAAKWVKGNEPFSESELEGRICYAGIDLGWNDDLSCIGYLFPPVGDDEKYKFLLRTFIPTDQIDKRSREHKVDYRKWVEKGYLIETPGNFLDTAAIRAKFMEDAEVFSIETINMDRMFAAELMNQLISEMYPVQNFPQTYTYFNAPIIAVQKMVKDEILQHGNNPILNWMISNVELKRNVTGLVMIDKSEKLKKNKVDGAVCITMCVNEVLEALKEPEMGSNLEFIVI